MKKILVLLCFILYIISAHAQYCSIKKGRTAYYVTTEVKEGKTLKDTMCIADVVDKGDRLIIREDAFGDHYDSLNIKIGTNITFYIYYKNQDMTEVILLDGESENETMNSEVKKISQEEFEKLQSLNQEFLNITMDLGAVEVQKMALNQRKEMLEKFHMDKQKESEEFTASLREKYGDVSINVSTGEFVETNQVN
jgi:uncharacterized protein YrzB (UPF0473 family)